ncbi:hypothetical protein, partial [Facilibium subflavum]|uniref:hypothetical protein n=1 Tax=Facilibium subflavum TaxID=2219058 RepID=UPI0013C353C4
MIESNKTIAQMLSHINVLNSLTAAQFHGIVNDLNNLSRKEIFTEYYKQNGLFNLFGRFHQAIIKMLEDNVMLLSDQLHDYHQFLLHHGNQLLTLSKISQWHEIYKQRHFVYFLKEIESNQLNQLGEDEICHIIEVIKDFFNKDCTGFNQSYHYLLENILMKLYRHIQMFGCSDRFYKNYKTLHQQLIQSHINFDFYIVDQSFSVEINPLSETLEINPVNFSNAQAIGPNFKGVYFNNQHIQMLNIDVHPYGFDAQLDLDLVINSENLHPEYLYLFHGMPLSIAVIIRQTYRFKTLELPDKSFAETLVYHGFSMNHNHATLFSGFTKNRHIKLSLEFCDPLKALLSQSHPMRIVKHVNYNQLMDQLLTPFMNLITMDKTKAQVLTKILHPQIFIFCAKEDQRSLYDFFIETLKHHGVHLQYQYQLKSENHDAPDQSLADIKITPESHYICYETYDTNDDYMRSFQLPQSQSEYNAWNFNNSLISKSNSIVSQAALFHVNGIENDTLIAESKEEKSDDQDKNGPVLPTSIKMDFLYDDSICIISNQNYYQKYQALKKAQWQQSQNYQSQFSVSWHQWPLLSTKYPSQQILDLPDCLQGSIAQYSKQAKLVHYCLKIRQTQHMKSWVSQHIERIADSQEDLKENPQLHIEKLGMLSSHSDKNKTFP